MYIPYHQKHLLDKFFAQPTHINNLIEGLVQWALLVCGHGKSEYFRKSEYIAWEKITLSSNISNQTAIDQPLIVAKATVQPSLKFIN